MARWKLMAPHYLNTGDTEWEYNETSRSTGKQVRRRFPVPQYLNPQDPGDWTRRWGSKDNEEGEIVVCFPGKGEDSDLVFVGDPTPDMVPVDDEARALSASFEDRWRYKPETSEISYSQSLVDKFEEELADIKAKPAEVPGLAELTSAITQMVQSNQQLLAGLVPTHRKI
jgi:hypothetical protein